MHKYICLYTVLFITIVCYLRVLPECSRFPGKIRTSNKFFRENCCQELLQDISRFVGVWGDLDQTVYVLGLLQLPSRENFLQISLRFWSRPNLKRVFSTICGFLHIRCCMRFQSDVTTRTHALMWFISVWCHKIRFNQGKLNSFQSNLLGLFRIYAMATCLHRAKEY